MMSFLIIILFYFNIVFSVVKSDLPVHCHKEQIEGEWIFRINKETFQPKLDDYRTTCGHGLPNAIENTIGDSNFSFENFDDLKLILGGDYKVYDYTNSIQGNWTTVYDEGFILYFIGVKVYGRRI